jgi:hypothetical protein
VNHFADVNEKQRRFVAVVLMVLMDGHRRTIDRIHQFFQPNQNKTKRNTKQK